MYDELVKDLRENHDKYFARDMQAADVIGELSHDYEKLAEDFNGAVELLHQRSKPHWIPVTERLPKLDENVLVYNAHSGLIYIDANIHFDRNATHWMPLPSTEGLNET